jgi:hypothetical protein
MADQLFDRDYQAGRAALNAGIGALAARLTHAAAAAFDALNRAQFSAPWSLPRSR